MMFVEPNWGHDSGHASRVLRQVEILPTVLTHSPSKSGSPPLPLAVFFRVFRKEKLLGCLKSSYEQASPNQEVPGEKLMSLFAKSYLRFSPKKTLEIVSKFSESYELLSGPTNRRVSIHSTGNQGQRTPFNRGPHTQLHCRSVDWGPSC